MMDVVILMLIARGTGLNSAFVLSFVTARLFPVLEAVRAFAV
jgi:hypothetical protein